MLARASLWQSAQARLFEPGFAFHRDSPSSTQSMPGLALSSDCMACVSRLISSKPERRSAGAISAELAASIPKAKNAQATARPVFCCSSSLHRDLSGTHSRLVVIVRPAECQHAAFAGDDSEGDERIGCHRRKQLGAENLLAIIQAREALDDIARDRLAFDIVAISGLHWVSDQRLHLDDAAALGFRRYIDERARHLRGPPRRPRASPRRPRCRTRRSRRSFAQSPYRS